MIPRACFRRPWWAGSSFSRMAGGWENGGWKVRLVDAVGMLLLVRRRVWSGGLRRLYLTLVFIPPTEYLYKHEANTGASKGGRNPSCLTRTIAALARPWCWRPEVLCHFRWTFSLYRPRLSSRGVVLPFTSSKPQLYRSTNPLGSQE